MTVTQPFSHVICTTQKWFCFELKVAGPCCINKCQNKARSTHFKLDTVVEASHEVALRRKRSKWPSCTWHLRHYRAVLWLRRLVAGFLPRRHEFEPRSDHVGLVGKKQYCGRLFPSTSVSPVKCATDCSTIITIQGLYNRSIIVDSVPFHPKGKRHYQNTLWLRGSLYPPVEHMGVGHCPFLGRRQLLTDWA
jgi:hypothetical protein